MDKTTQSGLKPDYVANQILYCITHKQSELTLAPFYVRLVIGLRVLAPCLYFKIMAHRAKKEQSLIKKKD